MQARPQRLADGLGPLPSSTFSGLQEMWVPPCPAESPNFPRKLGTYRLSLTVGLEVQGSSEHVANACGMAAPKCE